MSKSLDVLARETGIVGAGGAGFPTCVKLEARPETVIINGAECEPLLQVDKNLLRTGHETLLAAINALAEHFRPRQLVLAFKRKHDDLIRTWNGYSGGLFTVFPLDDFFPAGDEQTLVESVTQRVIPSGGIPLSVGAVVLNVETVYNLGLALAGKPLTDKFLTVAGAVRQPCTLRVPLGTPLREVLNMAGGATIEDPFFIVGGPMMGKIAGDLSNGVSKTTKGLLVLPRNLRLAERMTLSWQATRRQAMSSCEVCRACTDMCPRYLLGHNLQPHRFMRVIAFGGALGDASMALDALLCVECGVCENYACPVSIRPRRVMAELKEKLLSCGARYPRRDDSPPARAERHIRRIPAGRLISRLGLKKFDVPAPLMGYKECGTVTLSLKPPFGAPCQPQVKVGDRVEKGDLVGEIPEKSLGARIHASIAGMVVRSDDESVTIEARGRS